MKRYFFFNLISHIKKGVRWFFFWKYFFLFKNFFLFLFCLRIWTRTNILAKNAFKRKNVCNETVFAHKEFSFQVSKGMISSLQKKRNYFELRQKKNSLIMQKKIVSIEKRFQRRWKYVFVCTFMHISTTNIYIYINYTQWGYLEQI